MSKSLTALVAACALIGFVLVTEAQADVIDLGTAVLAGGDSFIAGGSRIKFDPNISGETATFNIPSTPGAQITITVTGQNDQSSSFFQFLVNAGGPGPGGFVPLASHVNFAPGFTTVTLPAFTDIGTSDFLRIVNGGTGNSEGQISAIVMDPVVGVPGPVVGAGLPGVVLALSGLLLLGRRRRERAA